MFLLNFSPLKNQNKKYVATPNETVPDQGRIFQNSKTTFPFHSTLLFKKRDSESCYPSGSGEGPQIGDSAGDQTQNLWFHKRIKLEFELGIWDHMVH